MLDVLKEALLITLVVTALMALVEALDFSGKGRLLEALRRSRPGQLILGSGLGATPGCVGAYAAVGLYSEGVLSFGALLACVVATTGDEAFLMLARFPGKALLLFAGLFLGGILAGWAWDTLHRKEAGTGASSTESSTPAPGQPAVHRHGVGLKGHLAHLAPHALRVFLWTFGVLLALHLASRYVDLQAWMSGNTPLMILLAVAVGFIPQSGPHMIFVTLFAEGVVSLPVLLASSITQDGHAGLPLLAQSGRSFLRIKLVKASVALLLSFALWLPTVL